MTDYGYRQFARHHDELALQEELDSVWHAESLLMGRNSPLAHTSDNTWPWTTADLNMEDYGL